VTQENSWGDWAQYFDLMDADRSPFLEFYGSLLNSDVHSLLELASGTGLIVSALTDKLASQLGNLDRTRIVGIDESPEMLRIARARDQRVTWMKGDIREPIVSGPFDLVICCYNTLQQMLRDADLLQVFRVVQGLLSNKGIFAFDIYQPNPAYLSSPAKNRLVRSVPNGPGRYLEIREDTAFDPRARLLTIDWRLMEQDAPSSAPLAQIQYIFRQYTSVEINRLLTSAGLSPCARYGDLNRSPFTPTSKKQVMICRLSS
jgi:SAM-dependent methyltransferase